MSEFRHSGGGRENVADMLRRELAEVETQLQRTTERAQLLGLALAAVEGSASSHAHDGSGADAGLRAEAPGTPAMSARTPWSALAGPLFGRDSEREVTGTGKCPQPVNLLAVNDASTTGSLVPSASGGPEHEQHTVPIGGRAGEPPMRGAMFVDRVADGSSTARSKVDEDGLVPQGGHVEESPGDFRNAMDREDCRSNQPYGEERGT
ncbi:MAG: hypothetical protein ACYDEY_07790 [Acidimicrobiales bacterium]